MIISNYYIDTSVGVDGYYGPCHIEINKDSITMTIPSDDVCDYFGSVFGHNPSCHKISIYNIDNWKFCPYCGKPIRIIYG